MRIRIDISNKDCRRALHNLDRAADELVKKAPAFLRFAAPWLGMAAHPPHPCDCHEPTPTPEPVAQPTPPESAGKAAK